MAFTFTVETGDIVPGANSYVTVEEADDYLAANIHVGPVWTAQTTETKERLLVWASRFLDQRAAWNGKVIAADQPMRWPRSGVKNSDDIAIAPDSIPRQLKEAVVEMARYLIEDRAAQSSQDSLKKLKVDVIEFEFREGATIPEIPGEISNLLAGLGSLLSGPRNFAKIRRA